MSISEHTRDARGMTDSEKAEHIRRVISTAGQALRDRHTWLRHQDAIGALIMGASLAGMVASGWHYVSGVIPWWICVPCTAIFASFIHELEHDLIHQMYFRHKPWANTLMLALGWLARASTVNPFVRRRLHMHHHKFSGMASDLEERAITNGEPWGIRRLLMTGDNMLAVMLRLRTMSKVVRLYIREQKPATVAEGHRLAWQQALSYLPFGNLYYFMFYSWMTLHILAWTSHEWLSFTLAGHGSFATVLNALDVFAVVYMLPSFLRSFCLHFISSNMHYCGDIDHRNPMQQCQVLNHWALWPLQLFCFNFGSTHAIHHFVVKEPFYIRQMTASAAHAVMREMGVRFNDFGTFRRANRFGPWQVA